MPFYLETSGILKKILGAYNISNSWQPAYPQWNITPSIAFLFDILSDPDYFYNPFPHRELLYFLRVLKSFMEKMRLNSL